VNRQRPFTTETVTGWLQTSGSWESVDRVGVASGSFLEREVVAGVRSRTDLPINCPQDPHQFASAQQIGQLEGLAVAIPWGFESPLPHHHSLTPAGEGCPP